MAVDKNNQEEQDLERYGVWVKAGPDEINEQDNTSIELMEIEDSSHDELLITEEEEKLLGELEESTLPDFDDFDDFDGMEDPFEEAGESYPSSNISTENDGESKELLHKIEMELSALRNEIRELKDELTGLKVPSVPPAENELTENGGFFDEEEDETIALTGDELENILDSADMTEESADSEAETVEPPAEMPPPIPETDAVEDDEVIDLSDDFTELSLDDAEDFDVEDIEDFDSIDFEDTAEVEEEPDPAISILSSPDENDNEGDPETIEIDIPGSESPDNEPVVSIDDIESDFEDITDLEDFGLEETDNLQEESIEIPFTEEPGEELLTIPAEETVLNESFEQESFDEGEVVEIDLTDTEDEVEISDDSETLDIEMEEISIDDFNMDDSDVLAVSEPETEPTEINPDDFETVDFESDLADSIDMDTEDESAEAPGFDKNVDFEPEDISLEEIGLDEETSEELVEDVDLELEEIDLDEEASEELVEDVDLELEEVGLDEEASEELVEDVDLELEEIGLDEEAPEELVEDVDLELEEVGLDETAPMEFDIEEIDLNESSSDDIPEISLDNAIEAIEPVNEFSLEDEPEEVSVILPDNDFNELPGTEDIDIDSLDAFVSEETEEEVEKIPEVTELPNSEVEGLREKTKAALELSSLPGDLKEEIKEVLKYMDQLLESLPDDKIQEFARSEHFEVYKKIFEELGIND